MCTLTTLLSTVNVYLDPSVQFPPVSTEDLSIIEFILVNVHCVMYCRIYQCGLERDNSGWSFITLSTAPRVLEFLQCITRTVHINCCIVAVSVLSSYAMMQGSKFSQLLWISSVYVIVHYDLHKLMADLGVV